MSYAICAVGYCWQNNRDKFFWLTMKVQTCCPCCAQKAMTLYQKMTLSRYSTHSCANCGKSLGVEQTGTGWFVFGWIPFSLSGLFSLPLKVVFGCIGIGLILFPYIYLIPLVEKSAEIAKQLPRWLLPWLSIILIGMFSSDWVNFLPSNETRIVVMFISVVLAIPIIQVVWQRTPKADEKILAFVGGVVLVVTMHYFALSSLPPALLTFVAGEQQVIDAKIVHKSHSKKLTRCPNKVEILLANEDRKHEICISEGTWKPIKNDDRVLVTSLNTGYGRLVTTVAPSTQGDYDISDIGDSRGPKK